MHRSDSTKSTNAGLGPGKELTEDTYKARNLTAKLYVSEPLTTESKVQGHWDAAARGASQ